ncbi:MAG: tRNA sulfurtransferase [Thermoplasmatota archaeon]
MRLLALVSGGIDSPVAAHMMMARGAEVALLHFDNRPYGGLEHQLTKVREVARVLGELHGRPVAALAAPHGASHRAFIESCRPSLHCVLCRRMMLRVAGALARRLGAGALVTGESLGQVASQTLRNIATELSASPLPILRPLIGLDKQEVVEIAKRIGTYEISIQPGSCCTAVPVRPATAASLRDVESEERRVDMETLLRAALEGVVPL